MGPSTETPVRASSHEEQMKLEVDSRYTWRGGTEGGEGGGVDVKQSDWHVRCNTIGISC